MSHTCLLYVVVVTCLFSVALGTRVVDATASSALQLDPTRMWAQTPSSLRTSDTPTTGGPASAEELAKQLSNPIASLISVPFQSNFDFHAGPDNDKFKYTLNIQTTFGVTLQTESTYNWEAHQWTVPLGLFASQILKLGEQPLSVQFGPRVYIDGPSGGPEWGLRFNVVLLFPK